MLCPLEPLNTVLLFCADVRSISTSSLHSQATKETPLESHLYRVDVVEATGREGEEKGKGAGKTLQRNSSESWGRSGSSSKKGSSRKGGGGAGSSSRNGGSVGAKFGGGAKMPSYLNAVWCAPVLLTAAGKTHSIAIDPASGIVVDLASSRTEPVKGCITRMDHQHHQQAGEVFFQQPMMECYTPPIPFTFVSKRATAAAAAAASRSGGGRGGGGGGGGKRRGGGDGGSKHTMHGEVFLPPGYARSDGRCYPSILAVYGGPHVQLVANDYRAVQNSRCSFYSKMGYVCSINPYVLYARAQVWSCRSDVQVHVSLPFKALKEECVPRQPRRRHLYF